MLAYETPALPCRSYLASQHGHCSGQRGKQLMLLLTKKQMLLTEFLPLLASLPLQVVDSFPLYKL